MINVQASDRYALDGLSPIRHVVTALVRAQPRALTISEFDYKHHQPGDITRVQSHEKIDGERAANEWLVKWALTQLGPDQIEEIDGTRYQLKIPHEDIKWHYKNEIFNVHLIEDETQIWPGGNEPFSELNGEFHFNTRAKEKEDLTELGEWLKERGWNERLPAIIDEHGVVLVGHRRLEAARQFGVKPIIVEMNFGKDDADRLGFAIDSNMLHRPMSAKTRQRIAMYLYGERDWSPKKIAKALRVRRETIDKDLKDSKTADASPGRMGSSPSTTAEQEAEARRRFKNGETNMSALGRSMGITAKVIKRIILTDPASDSTDNSDAESNPSPDKEADPVNTPEDITSSVKPEPEPEPEPAADPVKTETEPEPEPATCNHEWVKVEVCKHCGKAHE